LAYLRLKLEPWLEAELERTARRENRRSLSDTAVAMLKEAVSARRRVDRDVDALVAVLRGTVAEQAP
jgi:hypothetical protein